MSTVLRVSAVDHPELQLFAKLLKSSKRLQEDLIERHDSVYLQDGTSVTPLHAAILIAKQSQMPSVFGDDSEEKCNVLQWFEFAYSTIIPALLRHSDPHSVAMGPIQSALVGRCFLTNNLRPLACDWLVWAILGQRISAMTSSVAKEHYWRVVRWGEYLRGLAGSIVAIKPFNVSLLSLELDNIRPPPPSSNPGKASKKKELKHEEKKTKEVMESADPSARIDIRVGRITGVVKHPNADRLYIETVDFGEEQPRTVVSGLVGLVPIQVLESRLCCFLCNLKPAAICKTLSQAMILVGKNDETLQLLTPPEGSKPGDRVFVDGINPYPDDQLKQKEGVWPAVQEKLQVQNGFVVYSNTGGRLVTNLGAVTVELQSGIIS